MSAIHKYPKTWSVLFFALGLVFSGCQQPDQILQARGYLEQSKLYSQKAIAKYKELIANEEDPGQAHFELGLLYYRQGQYELASKILSRTTKPDANKYRALSLFKINDFTTARDVFKKINNPDDETLYYLGQVCEELNLYEEALEVYEQINTQLFKPQAQQQIQLITRIGENLSLSDLSPELQELIATAPPAQDYPNAGALILNYDEQIEITTENTAVYSSQVVIQILNERGKESCSEIVIGYDSTYEKVELVHARTIRPDGVVVPVGTRHIRDVSKYLNFPLYSNARARIISFPEITDGCVIEYKYKVRRNQLLNKDDYVTSYSLQEFNPIIKAKFKMIVPKYKQLHYKVINAEYNKFGARLEPIIKEFPQHREYYWEFKNIPEIIPESDMPPTVKINSIILISTFDSWQEVYDWWWDLAKDKISSDQAIKQKVQELTEDKDALLDKIKAIYNFCAEDIRYVAVEYGQAGHEPHKATDIFSNKYGDCKDQAILLITMLEEIGVIGYPVLIGTDDYLNLEEDFPSLHFNHCIAAVEVDDQLLFFDPTCSTCSFDSLPSGDQQRKVLTFSDAGYKIEQTPIYPPEHNRIERTLRMEVNPDETIKAKREVSTFGAYDAGQRFWLRYSNDEAISEFLKQTIQGVCSAARLQEYNIENVDDLNKNVTLTYSFWGQEYWTKASNLRIFPQLSLVDSSLVAKQLRRYPLDLGFPGTNKVELDVLLPQGLTLNYLPANFKKTSPWFDLVVEYKLDGNNLYFKQSSQTKKRYVLLSEYEEFKNLIETISMQLKERIILQRNQSE